MDLRNLTREQKELGVAGCMVIFIITLFLKWYSVGDFSAQGSDLDSWWIALVIAIIAGAVFAADALRVELPLRVGTGVATYLTSLTFFYVFIFLFGKPSGFSLSYGIWLALIFTVIGTGLAVTIWREDR